MRKLTLQFIYILCIYNIAVYTLIRTSLLAFIAYNQNKVRGARACEKESENERKNEARERSEKKKKKR